MAEPAGITVHLRNPDEVIEFPDATSATVGAGGVLVVVRARSGVLAEVIATLPEHRWWNWTPGIDHDEPPDGPA